MVKVLTIIVTYNGKKWVKKTILNVLNNTSITDILVIDNASSDDTVSLVKDLILNCRLSRKRLKLIVLDNNLGFGQANNIGMIWAIKENYNYVFLLNQDAWFIKGTLDDLVDIIEKHPNYGIVSPIHLNGYATDLDFLFKTYISNTSLLADLLLKRSKDLYNVSFVNAAAWLVKTELISKIGGFDPLFFHYGEDNDYVCRLQYFGYHIGITPNVYICHDRSQKISKKTFYKIFTFYLTELKRIDRSYKYSIFFVFKNIFDKFSSSVLLREFEEALIYLRVFFKLLTMLSTVYKSRKISKKGGYIFFPGENTIKKLYFLKENPILFLKQN